GDELSVLVDEEDGFGIGIPREAIADRGDAAVVLLVDDKLLDHSSRPLARRLAEPSLRIRTHSLAERGAKGQGSEAFALAPQALRRPERALSCPRLQRGEGH